MNNGNSLPERIYWDLVYHAIRLWNWFSTIAPLVLMALLAGLYALPSLWWVYAAVLVTVSWLINWFWNK